MAYNRSDCRVAFHPHGSNLGALKPKSR
jgi:hypothetical protein